MMRVLLQVAALWCGAALARLRVQMEDNDMDVDYNDKRLWAPKKPKAPPGYFQNLWAEQDIPVFKLPSMHSQSDQDQSESEQQSEVGNASQPANVEQKQLVDESAMQQEFNSQDSNVEMVWCRS